MNDLNRSLVRNLVYRGRRITKIADPTRQKEEHAGWRRELRSLLHGHPVLSSLSLRIKDLAYDIRAVSALLSPGRKERQDPRNGEKKAERKAMPYVFVSYRRTDSQFQASDVKRALMERFGEAQVFFDTEAIPLGRDYRPIIRKAVDACNVALVIIGPGWLDALHAKSKEREDFVRLEVEWALARGDVPVIPVLLACPLPREADLPVPLRELVSRQAFTLRPGHDFDEDLARLLTGIVATLDSD